MSKGKVNNELYWKQRAEELEESLNLRDKLLGELTYESRGERRIGWHGDTDVTHLFEEYGVKLDE